MKKALTLIALAASLTLSAKPKFVTYEKYGAKGNGKTDDMEAIIAAHEAANEWNVPVKAKKGRTYYIGACSKTAIVQTDVDWTGAKFIIDDTKAENLRHNIFKITSRKDPISLKGVKALKIGDENLGKTLPARSIVIVENKEKKVFIRYGKNENGGSSMKDILVVNPDGTIDPNTAVMWNYEKITKATAYPMDETTLTIKGGEFTTIANQETNEAPYCARNIYINRSNVIMEGVHHRIEGELDHGAPYGGFLRISLAADVLVRDCIFTGHTYYMVKKKKGTVSKGTYDISINTAANITMERISQFDDINYRKHWGVMGTNFCKNMVMNDCSVSRFDAHQGVENVTLKNSTFGHMGVRMVGCGTIYMENCTLNYTSLIALRGDYGSTWDGDIIIRNCVLRPVKGTKSVTILSGTNNGKHDFGYPCRVPRLIDIDGLVIDDSALAGSSYTGPNVFAHFGYDTKAEGLLPYGTDCKVILKNVSVTSGKPIGLSSNPDLFKDAVIERL